MISLAFIPLVMAMVLFAFGWRGRRLDSHPVCRKCRFDLSGLGAPERCPECGRDVSTPKRRRIGNRANRPLVLASSALSLLGAIAFGGFMISGQQVQWNTHKPAWLLEAEARWLPANIALPASEELWTRAAKTGNTPAPALLDAALHRATQERLKITGTPDAVGERWAQLLTDAIEAGVPIDASDRAGLARHMILGYEHQLNDVYLAGVPFELGRFKAEFREHAPFESRAMMVTVESASIDGKAIAIPSGHHMVPLVHRSALHMAGAGDPPSGMCFRDAPFQVMRERHAYKVNTPPLEPGEHTITLNATVKIYYNPTATGKPFFGQVAMKPDDQWTQRFERTIRVTDRADEAVTLATTATHPPPLDFITFSPHTSEADASASQEARVSLNRVRHRNDGRVTITVSFLTRALDGSLRLKLPYTIVGRAAIEHNGQRYPLQHSADANSKPSRIEIPRSTRPDLNPKRGLGVPWNSTRGDVILPASAVHQDTELFFIIEPDLERASQMPGFDPTWGEDIGPLPIAMVDDDNLLPSSRATAAQTASRRAETNPD